MKQKQYHPFHKKSSGNHFSIEKCNAQIIWTLNSKFRGYSKNSDEKLNATFKMIFSDIGQSEVFN